MAKPTHVPARVRRAVDAALEQLDRLGLSEQSERAIRLAWRRFLSFLEDGWRIRFVAEIDRSLVASFVRARRSDGTPPSVATTHWRRSAVRLLFRVWRELGIADSDPSLDLRLPAKSRLHARPLTDDEIPLCRWASLATAGATRVPAIWALAEAGASSGEIPVVLVDDLDLEGGVVVLPGTTHAEPRTVPLTAWGVTQLRRRVGEVDGRLVYDGAGRSESMQASVCGAVGDVLRRAGLAGEADVRPRSVTAWVGRKVFDGSGRIDEVARRLGLRSLDRAAALIGWDWR